MSHPRPRFQARRKTRMVTREEFAKGFYVYANGKKMHVGYLRIAATSEGLIVVEEPEWEEAFVR